MEGCGTPEGAFKMAFVIWLVPIVLLYMFIKYTYNYIRHTKKEP